jgi:hypothetical protein
MVIKQSINEIIHQVTENSIAQIEVDGTSILVRVYEDSKLTLSAPVYQGSNYIPKSVRLSIKETHPPIPQGQYKTFLTVEENNYKVDLNYLGSFTSLDQIRFSDLLEEFSFLANEWKLYLDENDRNDLIHVRAK